MRILKWVLIIVDWLARKPLTVSPDAKSERVKPMQKKWARENEFDEIIRRKALEHRLTYTLIKGMIAKESSFNPHAIKPEPGFFKAYLKNLKTQVLRSKSKHDDRWIKYPNIFSCSYGLMQVLYSTALQFGFTGQYPSDLADPETGIEFGCKYLVSRFKYARGKFNSPEDIKAAAIAGYNGGSGAVKTKIRTGGVYPNQAYVNAVLENQKYFELSHED